MRLTNLMEFKKEDEMKTKMWCLFNTNTGKYFKLGITNADGEDIYVIGFATKAALIKLIGCQEDGEKIRKIEIEI